jgi:hypothetical protein
MSHLWVPWHIACYVCQVHQDSVTHIALCYDVSGCCHRGIATDRLWCYVVGQVVPDFPKDRRPFIFRTMQSCQALWPSSSNVNFSATVTLFSLLYLLFLRLVTAWYIFPSLSTYSCCVLCEQLNVSASAVCSHDTHTLFFKIFMSLRLTAEIFGNTINKICHKFGWIYH